MDMLAHIFVLPSCRQNAQCGGLHRDRILFHSCTSTENRNLRRLHKVDDKYIMDAGAASGITEKTQFTLYQNEQSALQNIPLGTLLVTQVNAFDSELRIPSHAKVVALQTKAGTGPLLPLHVPRDDSGLDPVFKAVALMECTTEEPRKISLVEKDGATLGIALDVDARHLVFNILDKRVTQYGLSRMPFPTEIRVDNITAVLSAAVHYYWHLNRTVDNPQLAKKIDVQFTALKDDPDHFDEYYHILRYPCGPNLIKDGVIHVNTGACNMYGMKITNNSTLSLYISVFYFDSSDLSISEYILPRGYKH